MAKQSTWQKEAAYYRTMALDIPETSVCLNCRYLLRGLKNPVCPECGRRFVPDDRMTYSDQHHRGVLYRWTHPPRNWLRYVVFVLTTAIVLESTAADSVLHHLGLITELRPLDRWVGDFPLRMLIAILVISFAIALQHYALVRLAEKLRCLGAPPPVRKLMRWWWSPLCISLILTIAIYPWPLVIRFHLSRPWLERAARNQLAVGRGTFEEQVSGLYILEAVRVYPAGFALLLPKGHNSPRGKFVFSPDSKWRRRGAYRIAWNWWFVPRW